MELNINVDIKEEDWLYSLNEQQRATLSQVDKARVLSLFSRPSRVETAKQSLRSLVMGLPEDQDISLVTFNSCSAPPSRQGPFLGKQHADLLQYIEDLEVDGGTPLATSLEAAASMVDGKNRDAIVVAFLDGEDGCDRNQCEVAARIAEKQPRLTFNVVDISGRGLSDCIAKESGGRIYTARDTTHITEALQQSVLAIPKNTHCP
ncbi:vWA domain-containing protein [Castellaniella sp.]|uniref:vWA domain-containing protein n=1 Tax=Castellaniella sp. TaxID=1955812 RepID=UPI002AFF9F54|nr:VWA domain-containing protein [Castellaniella sp.]